jgi:hypothetical protein
MKPSVGDRFTRPGHPDVVVTSVSDTTVSFTNRNGAHTVPLSKFIDLAIETSFNGTDMIPSSQAP